MLRIETTIIMIIKIMVITIQKTITNLIVIKTMMYIYMFSISTRLA